jgi:hypothetical protein
LAEFSRPTSAITEVRVGFGEFYAEREPPEPSSYIQLQTLAQIRLGDNADLYSALAFTDSLANAPSH